MKYFNIKGSFSDPHTVRGLTKAGKEVSSCADFCNVVHFNISGHLGARLSFCKLLEVFSIVLVSEICIFHLEKLFMNLTGAF